MTAASKLRAATTPAGGVDEFFGYYTMAHEGWTEDPDWTDPGNGNAMTDWRNNGNSGGSWSVIATGTDLPFRSSVTALNSKPAIEFTTGTKTLNIDGATVSALSQPNTLVMVLNARSTGVQKIADGDVTRNYLFTNATNTWVLFAGTSQGVGSMSTGAYVIVALFDGANSLIRLNGAETTVAATVGTATHDGVCIGRDYNDTTSAVLDVDLAYFAFYDGDLTADADFADWEQAIGDHYSITIA